MSEHVMDNPGADRVKKTAALATRAGRRKQGLFLAEGPQPVREALKLWLRMWQAPPALTAGLGRLPELDALYFDPKTLERHPDLQGLLDQLRGVLFDPQAELPTQAKVFLREATPEVLRAMGDAETPQGIIAVCRIPAESTHLGSARAAIAPHPRPALSQAEPSEQSQAPEPPMRLGAVLFGLQDPGNVGTIIRTASAVGADAVVLSAGSADPWAPKVVRSGAGAHFHLPVIHGIDALELVYYLRTQGTQVLATAGEADLSLADLQVMGSKPDLAAPTVWMLGNEAHGLSAEEQALADWAVSIPLYGQAESLNVAIAGSICLYQSALAKHRERR